MSYVGTTIVSTTTTTTTTTMTRSRIAQLMGFSGAGPSSSSRSPSGRDNDEEWYIPYNGPIEPPPRRRPRGNTFGSPGMDTRDDGDREDDTFGYGGVSVGRPRASSNARSYTSTSSNSHSHSHTNSNGHAGPKTFYSGSGGGGIGEAPVHNVAAARDRVSTYSARPISTYSTRDRASTFSTEGDREREQRGSIASFLTFGQGSRKPSVRVNTTQTALSPTSHAQMSPNTLSPGLYPEPHMLSPTSGRRGDDLSSVFLFPARGRQSEEGRSHAHTPFQQHPQSVAHHGATFGGGQHDGNGRGKRSLEARGRSTAIGRGIGFSEERGRLTNGGDGLDSAPTSASTALSRSSTEHQAIARRDVSTWFQEDADLDESDEVKPMEPSLPIRQAGLRTLSHSASQPVLSNPNASGQQQYRPQPHPYAMAFPSAYQPLSHSASVGANASRPAAEPASHYSTITTTTTTHLPSYQQPDPINLHVQAHVQAHAQAYMRTNATSTATVSPAAIAAALNTNSRRGLGPTARPLPPSRGGSLRASISTPNLRSLFSIGNADRAVNANAKGKGAVLVKTRSKKGSQKVHPLPAKTQYEAETWCDALMFPRPRFRAHVVSPPSSPNGDILQNDRAVPTPWPISREVGGAGKAKLTRAMTVTVRPPSPGNQSPALFSAPPKSNYLHNDPHPSSKHHFASTPPRRPIPLHHPSQDSQRPSTPGTEVILRVVAEGERRDQERETWNEVARSSFQNRRSRSLSRTRPRKKSSVTIVERERLPVRARVESDAGVARARASDEKARGLARSLTVGLTTLASEAFRQPTPTISTMSASYHGGTESNAHSRNNSESVHRHGHLRNTSWGKAALRKICAPEDGFSDAAVSPEEQKQEKLEDALMHQKTARLRVRGRREEAEEADVQFLDIAPLSSMNAPRRNEARSRLDVAGDDGRSRSQTSIASDSLDIPTVGIALSTPPGPSVTDLPDLSAHPYAQPSIPSGHAESVPVSATYAGPHPTSVDYNVHRLPSTQPNIRPPEERMFVALESGVIRQVSTPEIMQPSTAWERDPNAPTYASNPSAYAYASVVANEKRESTLGVEEALMSRTFRRGGGSVENSSFASGVVDHEKRSTTPRQELSPPASSATPQVTSRVHRKPVALNPFSATPSLSHTVTTAPQSDVPDPELVHHTTREVSTALSSPSSHDSISSRMSPRHLGTLDDLEPFRDLFYKPGRSGSESIHQRTPSSEGRKRFGLRDTSMSWEDRIRSNEGLGGLQSLTRHLSEESQLLLAESQRFDGIPEERRGGQSPSLPGLNDGSLQMGTPLRAEYGENQDFPEDIHSSRASSVIEHESIEETLRLGTVPLIVPEHTQQTEQRQSTALSIGDTEDDGSLRPNRDTVFTTNSSHGIPGNVDDLLRRSFVTTTSSTSHMSSHMSNIIGDFPVPPVADGITPPAAAALQAYFPDDRRGDLPLHSSSLRQDDASTLV